MTAGDAPWPTELRISKDRRTVTVTFESGERFDMSAEYLRVMSPSAETRGHGGQESAPVTGKAGVTIDAAEPVGRYAVRLAFSDGHATGLYSWPLLYRLGRDRDQLWHDYQDRVAAAP